MWGGRGGGGWVLRTPPPKKNNTKVGITLSAPPKTKTESHSRLGRGLRLAPGPRPGRESRRCGLRGVGRRLGAAGAVGCRGGAAGLSPRPAHPGGWLGAGGWLGPPPPPIYAEKKKPGGSIPRWSALTPTPGVGGSLPGFLVGGLFFLVSFTCPGFGIWSLFLLGGNQKGFPQNSQTSGLTSDLLPTSLYDWCRKSWSRELGMFCFSEAFGKRRKVAGVQKEWNQCLRVEVSTLAK